MQKWGGFEIKKENVVLFDNTEGSLQPLIEKLSRGNMTFAADIEQRCERLGKELPGDFKRQDKEEGTSNHGEFMAMMQLMQESNQKFFEMMSDQQKASNAALVAALNRPVQVVSGGGGRCAIF